MENMAKYGKIKHVEKPPLSVSFPMKNGETWSCPEATQLPSPEPCPG